MPARRAYLFVNRSSRRGPEAAPERLAARLRAGGYDVEPLAEGSPQALRANVRERVQPGELVVLAGGDGTLSHALDALVATGATLGILPFGTANDLARALGIPSDLDGACEVIALGRAREIDLGRVDDLYFANVASFGFSAQVARRLRHSVKRRWRTLAYGLAALEAARDLRAFTVRVEADGQPPASLRSVFVAVGNGRYFGGGVPVAHDKRIDDAHLDLFSVRPPAPWQVPGLLVDLLRGRQAERDDVIARRGRRFRVETPRPMRIDVDGELRAWTPAVFEVVPKALRVLAPPQEEVHT